MNRVVNSSNNNYWVDSRLTAQRPLSRTMSVSTGRAVSRRREGLLPSWVVFCMIVLAMAALCVTATMRTHAEMLRAADQYQKMNDDVEKLRSTNAALKQDVERLRTDSSAIEAAARVRLGMARANEIVIAE